MEVSIRIRSRRVDMMRTPWRIESKDCGPEPAPPRGTPALLRGSTFQRIPEDRDRGTGGHQVGYGFLDLLRLALDAIKCQPNLDVQIGVACFSVTLHL